MADNVYDLCSSDDDDNDRKLSAAPPAAASSSSSNITTFSNRKKPPPPPSSTTTTTTLKFAARPSTPRVVSILDDDDTDNDDNSDLNRKPAARPSSSSRKRPRHVSWNTTTTTNAAATATNNVHNNHNHNHNHDVVDLISASPPLHRRKRQPNAPSSSVARRPPAATHDLTDFLEVMPSPRKQRQQQTQQTPPAPPPLPSPAPKTPLERVLEVLPDVEKSHAEKLLRECKDNLDMVLSILADRSYPKSKDYDATTTPSSRSGSAATAGAGVAGSVVVKRTKGQPQPKYDYMALSSFEPSQTYTTEAMARLLYDFPFLRKDGIKTLCREGKYHYSIVRHRLLQILKGVSTKRKKAPRSTEAAAAATTTTTTEEEELKQFQTFKPVWATKWPTLEQQTLIGLHHCTKRLTRRPEPTITDPILKDEIQYAQWQLDEWMLTMEDKIKRQEARKRSERSGSGVECGCCFDRVPIEEMVACREEGHLFCRDCIQSYADTAVFSNGSLGTVKATGKPSCQLLCCDSSGCQSGFHEEHLQRAVSVKTLEKYNELQFRASIEAAGLQEEICSCPKCGFQADLPPNLIVFQCPVEDCRYESCRKCGKEPHIPLRCDEVVQKNREDEGRLKVEEAMAEAKIRKCPKCKTPIIKSDGCNKMTCRCGTKMCYICRKELTGINPYTHFCQTPLCTHKSCKACILHSNAEEDDERVMREAGQAAAQSYRDEVKEKDGEGAADVNIDVDSIMKTGVTARRLPSATQRAAPAGAAAAAAAVAAAAAAGLPQRPVPAVPFDFAEHNRLLALTREQLGIPVHGRGGRRRPR